MTDYVETGLVKRPAELAGEIERTHEALRKMVPDLESPDGPGHLEPLGIGAIAPYWLFWFVLPSFFEHLGGISGHGVKATTP